MDRTPKHDLSHLSIEELMSLANAITKEVAFRFTILENEKESLAAELREITHIAPPPPSTTTSTTFSLVGTLPITIKEAKEKVKRLSEAASSSKDKTSKPFGSLISETPARLKAKVERAYQITTKQGLCDVQAGYYYHKDCIWEVTKAIDLNIFALASGDKTVSVWNVLQSDTNNTPLMSYNGHQGNVNSVRFASTGGLVASGSGDRTCHIWRLPSFALNQGGGKEKEGDGRGKDMDDILLIPVEDRTESKSESKKSHKRRRSAIPFVSSPLVALAEHTNVVVAAEWVHTKTNNIVTGSWDTNAKLWDIHGASESLQTLSGHTDRITNVTSLSSLVLTSSYDHSFRLWDLRSASLLVKEFQGHSDVVRTAVLSNNESMVVSGGDDAIVKVWDLRMMKECTVIHCSNGVNRLSLSPISNMIAVPGDSGTTRIYDINGETKGVLRAHRREGSNISSGHKKMITSAAWIRDDGPVLTSSIDMSVLQWQVASSN